MSKGKLYRSSNGKIMGVCAGVASWLRVDIGLVRLGVIIAFFMSAGTVSIIYFALGIFLPFDEGSESVYNEYRGKRSYRKSGVTVEDVKHEFDNLKSRVSKMENSVFNKERDWDERFNKG